MSCCRVFTTKGRISQFTYHLPGHSAIRSYTHHSGSPELSGVIYASIVCHYRVLRLNFHFFNSKQLSDKSYIISFFVPSHHLYIFPFSISIHPTLQKPLLCPGKLHSDHTLIIQTGPLLGSLSTTHVEDPTIHTSSLLSERGSQLFTRLSAGLFHFRFRSASRLDQKIGA